ncbi:MAG: WD40 repeat domain-containing protein [Planctomycetes bacterium]|nr:WD40 repeat domain-containing protein [Planctomycetota bacterium]
MRLMRSPLAEFVLLNGLFAVSVELIWALFLPSPTLGFAGSLHQDPAPHRKDVYGDPLPSGAVARLRTVRWRHAEAITSVAFGPDGRHALSGSKDGTLALWDVETGQRLRTFEGHSADVRSVAFSPDGKYLLSGSLDTTLALWDVATGKRLRVFDGRDVWVTSVALSPNGKYVLSGESWKKTLALWDVETGKCFRTFEGHTGDVWSVAFSPDGKYALSGSEDKTLALWDVDTSKLLRTFEGHTGRVTSVAFSPDGKCALSGSWDGTLALWEVETGKCLRTLGIAGLVTSVAFSPDGRYALSGCMEFTPLLWDVRTGKHLRTFKGHENSVFSVAFSSSGRKIISGSADMTALIWQSGFSHLESARRWARRWQKGDDPTRRELLRETIANLKSDDIDCWEESRERLLALEGDAVAPLLEAYPLEMTQALSKETQTELSESVKRLNAEEPAVRGEAQTKLESYGWPILEWIRNRLKNAHGLSAEARSRLETVCQRLEDDRSFGPVRTVLVLLDLLPLPAAKEALKRYAEGPPESYATELARRELKWR